MSTSEPGATWQALKADQGPVLCTEAMAAEDNELLAGVTIDAANGTSGA